MGPNGSGKTTLLRTIVGELPPLAGRVRLGHRVVINYYAQSHEGLVMRNTVLEEIRRVSPGIKETEARTLLGRFLFSGDDVYKQVSDLSGGERSRVALAQLTLLGGNLLVLDEPTNHLDIDAREALETVLNEYNGTILFVSHDRYFIDAVADTIWMAHDGAIEQFRGTYSEYVAKRDARQAAARAPKPATPAPAPALPAPGRQANGRINGHAQAQPATRPPTKGDDRDQRRRQRRLTTLEQEIAALEADLKQIEGEIGAASAAGQVDRVTSLGLQHAELQEMLQSRYDEWASVAE
jgi:ATP-binding cassette subfamily F protein 3